MVWLLAEQWNAAFIACNRLFALTAFGAGLKFRGVVGAGALDGVEDGAGAFDIGGAAAVAAQMVPFRNVGASGLGSAAEKREGNDDCEARSFHGFSLT